MSLEPATLRALSGELKQVFQGAWLIHVKQIGPYEISITFQRGKERPSLCISLHPLHARLWWVTSLPSEATPSRFVVALRNRLAGAQLQEIAQVDFDRLLRIGLMRRGDDGSEERLSLVLELLHRRANLILVDDLAHRIIDCYRRGSRAGSRDLSPGADYRPPPQLDGADLTSEDTRKWWDAMAAHLHGGVAEALVRSFRGLPLEWAHEATHRAGVSGAAPINSLGNEARKRLLISLKELAGEFNEERFKPHLILDHLGKAQAISVIDLGHLDQGRKLFFPTTNQAIISLFHRLKAQDDFEGQRTTLLKEAKKRRRKLHTLKENLAADLSFAERADQFGRFGELIMANLQRLRRGMSRGTVIDVYDLDQREIEIELDPKLGPTKNADFYFKRSRKARSGISIIRRRLRDAAEKLDSVERVIEKLQMVHDPMKMEELARILQRVEFKGTSSAGGKSQEKKRKFRHFTTSDGWRVLVGRDDRENDELTHRLAGPEDLWFHAQGVPGSHVVLRREGKRSVPTRRSLEEAASLAAHFSRARTSKVVPVVYTLRKYVRRPRGAKPGVAVMEREKTLFVEPRLLDQKESVE